MSKVRRGILPQMSFSFRVPVGGDTWSDDRSERTVSHARLGGVSVVRTGANRTTEVSVRGRAGEALEVRTAGPVHVRQMVAETIDDGGEDQVVCPHCAGSGRDADGGVCDVCDGTGMVDADDVEDDGDRSAKYSPAELQHMVRLGHALPNAKGEPSYPIGDREDVRRAVRAVGRGPR